MQRVWVTSPSYAAALRVVIEARRSRGLTQRELAARLGKPRSFVSKTESLERRLDIQEFVAVARALGLEPRELMDDVLAALPAKLEF